MRKLSVPSYPFAPHPNPLPSSRGEGVALRVVAALSVWMLAACAPPVDPAPIASTGKAPAFIGEPAVANPALGASLPEHPYLAANGRSSMHNDGYASDSYTVAGPLGHRLQTISRDGSRWPGGSCPVHTFDRAGRLVVLCANVFYFELQLLEPRTLRLLARYRLPSRPSTFHALITLDPDKIMSDSSGAYFYLDEQDRVVIADARQRIQRIAHRETRPGEWVFEQTDVWDLSAHVPHDCVRPTQWSPGGECDPITAVMPDHADRIWWVTRRGRLGTLDPRTGQVQGTQLPREEIQNGFSVAQDGIYIVSDHAMYGFQADAQGAPQIRWRERYDRGSGRKTGSLNQGSGTTPTLMGEHYVAITDNADGRVNLLVYRRSPERDGPRLICRVPLFTENASATDNSPIGWGRSIVIENNHGYQNAFQQRDWNAVTGGITRVDVREDESGCDPVWHSAERAPSVVQKLSTATGLAYYYTYETLPDGDNAWYVMALDFHTGRTVYKALAGVGSAFDNNWSPLSLGPDGTMYVGVFGGLVAFWDTPQ